MHETCTKPEKIYDIFDEISMKAKGVNSWEDAINSLDLKVENKIKVMLPITPLLLTYEGSYNFESSIRLNDAWKKLKALIRQ